MFTNKLSLSKEPEKKKKGEMSNTRVKCYLHSTLKKKKVYLTVVETSENKLSNTQFKIIFTCVEPEKEYYLKGPLSKAS